MHKTPATHTQCAQSLPALRVHSEGGEGPAETHVLDKASMLMNWINILV